MPTISLGQIYRLERRGLNRQQIVEKHGQCTVATGLTVEEYFQALALFERAYQLRRSCRFGN